MRSLNTPLSTVAHGRRISHVLALAACLAAPASWAGRPLVTEDAEVLARGECEIEGFFGRVEKPRGDSHSLQLGCGVGGGTQLGLGAGRDRSEDDRVNAIAVNGKTGLREPSPGQPGLAIAYAASGLKHFGGPLRLDASEIKGVATLDSDGWLYHFNAGWAYAHEERAHRAIWALAVERPNALGPIDLMAETFGDNKSNPWVQLGARWAVVPERLLLDASWGLQSRHGRPRQATLGFTLKL